MLSKGASSILGLGGALFELAATGRALLSSEKGLVEPNFRLFEVLFLSLGSTIASQE